MLVNNVVTGFLCCR